MGLYMKKQVIKKIVIAFVCIAVNFAGKMLADNLQLPVWLDMIGTCLAVYYTGLFGGIVVGAANNVLYALFDFSSLSFALVGIAVAVFVYYVIKKGCFSGVFHAALYGFGMGILCTAASFFLNYLIYKGYTGNLWGDALVDMLRWHGIHRYIASAAGTAVVELVDKQLVMVIAFLVVHILKKRENRTKRRKKEKAAAMLLVLCILGSSVVLPKSPYVLAATSGESEYLETVYNNTNGLVSSEANTIEETHDGTIWIGGYAGITRFDGTEFEFIRHTGLTSVNCMLTDRRGRLWIGTNDSGIAVFDQGGYTYYTMEDGLPSNSVRCFAEDENGTMYIGTSDKICYVNPDGKLRCLEASRDIVFAKEMLVYQGALIVTDNAGKIYAVKGSEVQELVNPESTELYFNTIAITHLGLLAGTTTGELLVLDVSTDEFLVAQKILSELTYIETICETSDGRIWIGSEQGLGYFNKYMKYYKMYFKGAEASFECIHEDYQGNIWIASSRYGVIKLSKSHFRNFFEDAGIFGATVNVVIKHKRDYYCGTDQGLVVLNGDTCQSKENELTEKLKGMRIRGMLEDSEKNLWICTYAQEGLICYTSTGEFLSFNMKNAGTTSDRFRCMIEMEDGTVVCGTADGINYFKNKQLTGTITLSDGLENSQILCMVRDGKRIFAGSDGAGIYVISDGEIVDHINHEDGLSSDVVLRIVPYQDGYFLVTSNSLCYMDEYKNVTVLDQFPYYNNYDLLIQEDTAYIPCSAGIYKIDAEQLRENECEQFELYNAKDGLEEGLIANSWNYVCDDQSILLCSNNGVIRFMDYMALSDVAVKFGIDRIETDRGEYDLRGKRHIAIGEQTKQLTLYATVRNYTLTHGKILFYEEGNRDEAKRMDWNEIQPLYISTIQPGETVVHLELLDVSGTNVIADQVYTFERESPMWEKWWYKVYLGAVIVEIVSFIICWMLVLVQSSRRKKELEEKVAEQTKEIREEQKKAEHLFMQTVMALAGAVDAKDRYTSGHSKRVAEYSKQIAERMGKSEEEQNVIYQAGLLHDVGKIRIPEEIIDKPGKLTEEEFQLIKIHPVTGYHILRGIDGNHKIALGTKFHHERYDGKGYPNGLAGEDIPEIARILGVADSYDAMASDRSYRKALPQEVVRKEIEKGKGTQFDPAIADIMLAMIDEDPEYRMRQIKARNKTILVVDDELVNIKMIIKILESEQSYNVVAAKSGEQALAIIDKRKIDLILLDLMMPQMDGFETLTKLRENHDTPVILMTAERSREVLENGNKYGVDDYITKPFVPLQLHEIIHSMLN